MTYPILGDKKGREAPGVHTVFTQYSLGVATGRDAWAYNFSRDALSSNIRTSIQHYNAEIVRIGGTEADPEVDPRSFAWNRNARVALSRNHKYTFVPEAIRPSLYRPFATSNLYFERDMNAMQYSLRKLFPTAENENYGFYVNGVAAGNPFACMATRDIPCLDLFGKGGQFFSRYRWEEVREDALALDLEGKVVNGYRRVDNITDEFQRLMRERYGDQVTKGDVFFFIYGVLHSPEYRERYSGELKQMLPRVPKVTLDSFERFTSAGRELFHLHADYEEVERYPLEVAGGEQPPLGEEEAYYRVQKMRFPSGTKAADTPNSLVMNSFITVRGIPEAAYQYQLGSRSAIEWIIRQYQVTTDKTSGIVNDPNQWGIEHGNPRYILDLLQKVVTVSVRTVEITKALPGLDQ